VDDGSLSCSPTETENYGGFDTQEMSNRLLGRNDGFGEQFNSQHNDSMVNNSPNNSQLNNSPTFINSQNTNLSNFSQYNFNNSLLSQFNDTSSQFIFSEPEHGEPEPYVAHLDFDDLNLDPNDLVGVLGGFDFDFGKVEVSGLFNNNKANNINMNVGTGIGNVGLGIGMNSNSNFNCESQETPKHENLGCLMPPPSLPVRSSRASQPRTSPLLAQSQSSSSSRPSPSQIQPQPISVHQMATQLSDPEFNNPLAGILVKTEERTPEITQFVRDDDVKGERFLDYEIEDLAESSSNSTSSSSPKTPGNGEGMRMEVAAAEIYSFDFSNQGLGTLESWDLARESLEEFESRLNSSNHYLPISKGNEVPVDGKGVEMEMEIDGDEEVIEQDSRLREISASVACA